MHRNNTSFNRSNNASFGGQRSQRAGGMSQRNSIGGSSVPRNSVGNGRSSVGGGGGGDMSPLKKRIRGRKNDFVPELGQPGSQDDPRRQDLNNAQIRWYMKCLEGGMRPDEARRMVDQRNLSSGDDVGNMNSSAFGSSGGGFNNSSMPSCPAPPSIGSINFGGGGMQHGNFSPSAAGSGSGFKRSADMQSFVPNKRASYTSDVCPPAPQFFSNNNNFDNDMASNFNRLDSNQNEFTRQSASFSQNFNSSFGGLDTNLPSTSLQSVGAALSNISSLIENMGGRSSDNITSYDNGFSSNMASFEATLRGGPSNMRSFNSMEGGSSSIMPSFNNYRSIQAYNRATDSFVPPTNSYRRTATYTNASSRRSSSAYPNANSSRSSFSFANANRRSAPSRSSLPVAKEANGRRPVFSPRPLGQPGAADDPFKASLAHTSRKWYMKFLGDGLSAKLALQKALDLRVTLPIETILPTPTDVGRLPIPLGQPGAADDPIREMLTGVRRRWYIKYVNKDRLPREVALQRALNQAVAPIRSSATTTAKNTELSPAERNELSGAGKKRFAKLIAQGLSKQEAFKKAKEPTESSQGAATASKSKDSPTVSSAKPAANGVQTDKKLNEHELALKKLSVSKRRWYSRYIKQGLSAKEALQKVRNYQRAEDQNKVEDTKCIRVGVMPKNFPKDVLKFDDVEKLENAIMEQVALASELAAPIQFEGTRFKPSMLMVDCVNQETADWLVQVVPQLQNWKGVELMASLSADIQQDYTAITIIVPKGTDKDSSKVVTLIGAQNKGLKTENWKVLNEREIDTGLLLKILVDNDSLATIASRENILSFKFGKIKCNYIKRRVPQAADETKGAGMKVSNAQKEPIIKDESANGEGDQSELTTAAADEQEETDEAAENADDSSAIFEDLGNLINEVKPKAVAIEQNEGAEEEQQEPSQSEETA